MSATERRAQLSDAAGKAAGMLPHEGLKVYILGRGRILRKRQVPPPKCRAMTFVALFCQGLRFL